MNRIRDVKLFIVHLSSNLIWCDATYAAWSEYMEDTDNIRQEGRYDVLSLGNDVVFFIYIITTCSVQCQ